jgi:hypothetical protein
MELTPGNILHLDCILTCKRLKLQIKRPLIKVLRDINKKTKLLHLRVLYSDNVNINVNYKK